MERMILFARDAIDDGVPNPRGEQLAHLSIIFVCLSGFFVVLRLSARYLHTKMIGADDALIVGSQLLAICMTVTYNGEASNGFGLHTNQVSQAHQIVAFKWFFAAQILYKIATCLTKMSICVLYLRIFPSKRFRIAVWTIMGITIAYTIAAVFLTIFSCNPISKAWDKKLPGVCLDMRRIWYSTSVMIIITDLMIIIAPLDKIRKLQLPTAQRLLLGGLFSLGSFVIACTVVRMVSVTPETTASDQIYFQATSNSWTFLECNVGIICACLPVLGSPIVAFLKRFSIIKTRATNAGGSNPYNLRTIGQSDSRDTRLKSSEHKGEADSVEELINDRGITKQTAVHVTSHAL